MSKKGRQTRRSRKPKSNSSKGAGKSTAPSKLAPLEIENKARQAETVGDYERARTGYARLFREDAEKFGDDYLRVSREAFRELLRSGILNKAEDTLKQLTSLLSADELTEWQMRLAAQREQWEAALTIALSLQASTDPRLQCVAADVMVAADEVPEQVTLPDDAMNARRAMELFCKGDIAEALQAARAVPRTSLFSSWSLFIKGAAAFYDRKHAMAAEAFRRIPEQCAAAEVAGTLLSLKGQRHEPRTADSHQPDSITGGQLALILELCGEAKLARVIPQSLRALDSKGLAAAYDCVRDKCPEFVSLDVGGGAILTSYFLGAAVHRPNQDRLISRMSSRKKASHMDGMVAAILNYRGSERGLIYVEDPWYQFLKAAGKILDQWPHWNLIQAFVRLDEVACLQQEYANYCDEERQEEMLALMRAAVDVAPESETVALRYLQGLDAFRATSERNRFLDKAAVRFPDNATILTMAADRCVERNSLNKALKYYERAIELDPTNGGVRNRMVVCAVNLAAGSYSKSKPTKAAELMDLALRHAQDRGRTIARRGLVMARRSLMAQFFEGDPVAAEDWKRRASERVPGDALEFFMVGISPLYCSDPDLPGKKEMVKRMNSAAVGATSESVGLMIETMRVIKVVGLSAARKGKVLRCLREAFASRFASYVRNDRGAARQIPEFVTLLVDIDRTMVSKLLPAWLHARGDEEGEIAAELIDALLVFSAPSSMGRNHPTSSSLKKLEERSAACSAPELVQLARDLYNKAHHREQRYEMSDPFRDEHYDDEAEDDDGLAAIFGRKESGRDGAPPPEFIHQMLEVILAASPSEREELRKETRMPKHEWNELVKALETMPFQ